MPRRTIAAVLLLTLAMVFAPCASAAHALNQAMNQSHACCAPTLAVSPMDCCHSAAPSPATAPAQSGDNPACLQAVSALAPDSALPAVAASTARLRNQPARPLPPAILRT